MRPKVGSGDGYLNDAGMTRAARRSDRLSAVFLVDCGDGLPDKSRFRVSRAVEALCRSGGSARGGGGARMEWSLMKARGPDVAAQLAQVDKDPRRASRRISRQFPRIHHRHPGAVEVPHVEGRPCWLFGVRPEPLGPETGKPVTQRREVHQVAIRRPAWLIVPVSPLVTPTHSSAFGYRPVSEGTTHSLVRPWAASSVSRTLIQRSSGENSPARGYSASAEVRASCRPMEDGGRRPRGSPGNVQKSRLVS